MQNLFYFLSFLAILSALMVIFAKNPIHSVLYLIITFFAIAGHYVLLNAQFLAVVHIIVYAGAIMVLFLFVIMFLNLNSDTEPQRSTLIKVAGTVAGGLLFILLLASVKNTVSVTNPNPDMSLGLIKNLGIVLFRDFLLPFELVSVLFLAALIGAVMLGKKEEGKSVA
ncbi:MAG: NADH-quinone oxidoreductase subunit J [Cytophagales bacterium]|nr:NADH-quinone oxidoreductase subunit J [Cytophagales bacterium]